MPLKWKRWSSWLEDSSRRRDTNIWQWAKTNGFLICTKDSDFYHLAVLSGPPKVIWLKIGNCFTSSIQKVLTDSYEAIRIFMDDSNQKVLILGDRS